MPTARAAPQRVLRREMLKQVAGGFGYLALAATCAEARAAEPLAPKVPHHPARAQRVILLFMHGGVSQVDSFDYKPQLQRDAGKTLADARIPAPLRRSADRKLLGSHWNFRQYGQCGHWVSELFPSMARRADDLCVVKSMHTEGTAHGPATLRLHTGSATFVRPSIGSWLSYGLGTENRNLPSFVTICPPRAHGGVQNYSSAFLPAVHQGTRIGTADQPIKEAELRHLANPISPGRQREQLDLIQQINRAHLDRAGADAQLEGVIQSFELAFRMQSEAPNLMDLSQESQSTLDHYGIGREPTDDFGRQCLLARRFSEAGVRFVQVSDGYRWDQHRDLKNKMASAAARVDHPVAALLSDLKQRGLLDDTLVIWTGEFGRTSTAEGVDGRNHNPSGFTLWMAGGGVRPGFSYGASDEYGFAASVDKVHVHDLHATVLHLLGLDHTQLTYRYAGRDFRLTDVYGRVVDELIG